MPAASIITIKIDVYSDLNNDVGFYYFTGDVAKETADEVYASEIDGVNDATILKAAKDKHDAALALPSVETTEFSTNVENLDKAVKDSIKLLIDNLNLLLEGDSSSTAPLKSVYDETNITERLQFHTYAYKLYTKYGQLILNTTFFSDAQKNCIKTTILFANFVTQDIRNKIRISSFKLNKIIEDTGLKHLVLNVTSLADGAGAVDDAEED